MKIQAAVFYEPGVPFQVETLDLAAPRAGEVLVKVAAVGVCHSDWHLMTGATKHPLPVVPGHEGAGLVAGVGPGVDRVALGDHVALNWAPNCGKCFYCLNDRPSLCAAYVGPLWAGVMLDGSTRLSSAGGLFIRGKWSASRAPACTAGRGPAIIRRVARPMADRSGDL